MQDCIRSDRRTPKASLALRGVAGHLATGLALGALFVALLIASGDTPALRLLSQADNAPALLILLILHAALFTCASLATADARVSARPDDGS